MRVAGDEGYTLLEMLVAIAVMALASVPLAQSMSSGLSNWERLHSKAADIEEALIVRQQLVRWIKYAYAADPLRKGATIEYPFSGTATQLTFLTSINPDPRSDELLSVELGRTDDSELYVSISPDHSSGMDVSPRQAFLLNDVISIEFSYFDKRPFGGAWVDTWQSELTPPAAVRVRLERAGGAIPWTDLIIPTQIEEWAHCAFDAATQSCFSGADAG